jgi:hypothetical protein
MSFNASSLSSYTDQNRFPLLIKSFYDAKTLSLITPQMGVKNVAALNIMDSDIKFQVASCTWNSSGTTSFTQRNITVGKIAVMEELCADDLENYALQHELPKGATYTSLPFEQQYSELKAAGIAEAIETAIWQSDTTAVNGNLNKFDGLLKIINAGVGSGVIQATADGAITTTNVRTIFKDIYTKIPARIRNKKDLVAFCGWDTFATLINKVTDDNSFHYSMDKAAETGEMYYPGTALKVIAVNGLDGTDKIVCTRLANLFWGTDMLEDKEQFRIFRLEDGSDAFRFKAKFKLGAQVAFLPEIVFYKAA